jgi:hypothetical protein
LNRFDYYSEKFIDSLHAGSLHVAPKTGHNKGVIEERVAPFVNVFGL